ncbi:fructosamine kinase family protein [Aquirufa antheringensis]|jgi:fructosamine-3-kinase|uniref:Ketosamine-3-kinase n=1 Tax=Aquirufa antheringensis TaxID=2516559 RepID=A0A4Q9BGX6_9BACT|nr:fructosamine kinase family protein [Aquirufa antheringensis]MCZ2485248.1 fructosamine kinase family protein [Aquirufa antheringensis]MCZ2487433.1 fructosamine kinase family protein [Aquirufa antheringensis]MCZ2490397.1 fructosamine kinase family protein [Aquirufa antheringensis]TBH75549.1 ketosamine-3-kinase [Aquirufa antheringensis]
MSTETQAQYQFIDKIIQHHVGENTEVKDLEFFYGGNFNLAVRVQLKNSDEYFIKWNQGDHQGLFDAEAKNLDLIGKTSSISVPSVMGTGTMEEKEYLMMECIPSGEKAANYWVDFGEKLALLHKNTSESGHGLDYTNFIGAAPQINTWNQNGIAFFIEHRLRNQLVRAIYDRKIDAELEAKFETLFEKLPSLLPNEKSALIHGDLWSGNAMTNPQGLITLVDPACYYGFREAELAFTTMFGGFDESFYEAYHANFPIEKGFHERIPLYNLYPLLVHVNLFGEGYLPAVKKIVDSY